MGETKVLHLLHFNDAYHIHPQKEEPVAGAARFATAVHQFVDDHADQHTPDSFVLFSGDVFNPSVESAITRGRHMPPVLRELRINAACVGNHDFDFGVSTLQNLLHATGTDFPWLLSNVLDAKTGEPPEPLHRFAIIDAPRAGLRIGLVALVERDWIDTIPSFPPELKHHDQVVVANELSATLRAKPHSCDLIIALTHMRVHNDIALARACGPSGSGSIDLILGGHDHFFYLSKRILADPGSSGWDLTRQVEAAGVDPELDYDPKAAVWVVKSGTDFRELSQITVTIATGSARAAITAVSVVRREINSSVALSPTLVPIIESVSASVTKQTSVRLGYTHTPLSSVSFKIRTHECALGNLTSDLIFHSHSDILDHIDLALICSGALRGDHEIPPGFITVGDVMEWFPFEDSIVVIRIPGHKLLEAIEHSVSAYPAQEGRFPQVSGAKITFDPARPVGSRITEVLITSPPRIGEGGPESGPKPDSPAAKPILPNQTYVIATREYMASGYDGFKALVVPKEDYLVDAENGHTITQIYRRYFLGLKYLGAIRDHIDDECDDCKKNVTVKRVASKWAKKVGVKLAAEDSAGKNEDLPPFHPNNPQRHDPSLTIRSEAIKTAMHAGLQGRPCVLMPSVEKSEATEVKTDVEKDILVQGGYEHSGWGDVKEGDDEAMKNRIMNWASVAPKVEGRINILGA